MHPSSESGGTEFVSMQDNYKDIYREEEREINKFCNETRVGLVPRDPLNTGSTEYWIH
jgi:aryl-alcohol dehydrogenase-like predicted oxidoreductase